jgi:poly(3-hydroxybutyrate) depolymerase
MGSGGMAMGGAGSAGAPVGGMTSSGGSGVGGSSSTGESAGCGKAPTIASSMYNNGSTISIMAGSMQRRYILNVPTDYDNTKPYKLIIAFHQLDGNDKQMYQNGYYHLLNLSGNNAIFVAPNGQKNGTPCSTTGNGDGGCGWPNGSNSDIALADAVVAQVKENFCVDTNRIFATGWSYGGSMSYKTACERGLGKPNGYIRGIAVYSGAQLSGNCTPSSPVAYYGSHGDNDSVLGYDGGVTLAKNFATANGCTWANPTKVTSGNHMCTDIAGCTTGYPVKFCSFDGDHTPDPKDPGQGSSWQYQPVWDFFDQF